MRRFSKAALSLLISLLIVLGQLPWISITVHAEPTEKLLTTITATGKEQASYSVENVASVSFSYTASGSSSYHASWGWWGYGWSATVNAAEGYTITKCVFYDDANRTATDSEDPFVVETTEEAKEPQVNGTPILAYQSKGIKKIEVYGYANPTTVDVTGVSLNKETTTLTVGGTETLTATVRPDDATDKSVTWSSNDTSVATVDPNGLVTAVGAGTANITVTSNSDSTKNASCSVTVNPATYNVLLTGGSNATISGGSTSQSELSGAMETVTYTANSGYHFADFTDITQNGITVTKTSDSVVTVSGIPTADVNIVVPDAIAKTQISYTVTFNVENGSWNNGVSDAQTVTLTGYEGDTLTLAASQIPAVGSNPDATYKAGSWDTTPTAGMEITADTTFTYTYAAKTPISYTVTFNVANGSWNEGGSDAQTVTLTGYEGDTLTLAASQIPAVGSNPDATYKAGSWDTTPTAGMEITADTTFTYSYVKENTAPITYTNTEGEGSNYTLGTNGTLTFRFSRSENDAETINHFTGIKVDNVEVSSNNYTYSAGSVIINLKPEYLQTLSVGQHTLTAMFDDGGDVTVNFTIVAAAQNTPTPTPTPTPSGTAIASTGETFPMTVLYGIAMLIASALCIAVMSFIKPKKTR